MAAAGRGGSKPVSRARVTSAEPTVSLGNRAPPSSFIYLDMYMLYGVYEESGICLRNHCGAEPPRDLEPPGLVPTVGGRDRTSTSYAAADGVKAPACAARGRFRGVHCGRTTPSLSAQT